MVHRKAVAGDTMTLSTGRSHLRAFLLLLEMAIIWAAVLVLALFLVALPGCSKDWQGFLCMKYAPFHDCSPKEPQR
jgi:hypothetical protein